MRRLLARLAACRSGAGAAEFALVLPLLLLFIFGIIDVGRLMWTWNRAEKATHMGVRYAVVTNVVPSTLVTRDFALSDGVPGGSAVPSTEFSSTVCDTTSCTADASGLAMGYNGTAFDNIVARMQLFMPEISDANVLIDYENVGLGYAGDPNGPDVAPLVTVRLTGLQFEPLTFLAFGGTINLPDFRAALTLEDGAGTVSN